MTGRLQNIRATPHPVGNRIDLTWVNPKPEEFPGVRIVRREGTHPTSPQPGTAREGMVVADIHPGSPLPQAVSRNEAGDYLLRDDHLQGETVYYYFLFPFPPGDPPTYHIDLQNRSAVATTSSYNMAGIMYDLLPRIYHRYDTTLPTAEVSAALSAVDVERGQLRRFLDLPGGQLDQLQSVASRLLQLYNLDKIDGRLLPLLADWTGWKTDHTQEVETQRNEIRSAPFLYQTTGLIPTVEATVKRTTGWESRTKEFVHNILTSNRPERMNLWLIIRDQLGEWSEPTDPLSLDFVYEGRPTLVQDPDDETLWLFYHAKKKNRWEIWYKTSANGIEWSPSLPLIRHGQVNKHPTAVFQGTTLWLIWDEYDPVTRQWQIKHRNRLNEEWTAIADVFGDQSVERKDPMALVDSNEGLWLFWRQKVNGRWRLHYNRHDGNDWELGVAAEFPADGLENPRVEGDVFALFHPNDAAQPIWIFWARQEATGSGNQTRWSVAYRVKEGLDPTDSDWSVIRTMPKADVNDHDREPTAIVTEDGDLEVFWSADRQGSWSVWRQRLDSAAHTWTEEEEITDPPFSQRAPLPFVLDNRTLLFYRSNQSLSYSSDVYRATQTFDLRYSGSTTVHTRQFEKAALRGDFDDFQTYTYDAGKKPDDDWYARDTVGIYLEPDTVDIEKIDLAVSRVRKVLPDFLPITDRAVFISQSNLHTERVYTYGMPVSEGAMFIGESFQDVLTSVDEEIIIGPEDES